MLTLKYNPASERFDCYENGEYIAILTCGTRFNLYCDDEDIILEGRIEYHNTNGYYFIGAEALSRLLGHEDISITKRYLQSIQDDTILELATTTSPLMNIKGGSK